MENTPPEGTGPEATDVRHTHLRVAHGHRSASTNARAAHPETQLAMAKQAFLGTLTACLLLATMVSASSHREAPGITEKPKVDGTDFYIFNSYEPGREDYVTMLANYIPLQDAYGGPNYFLLDENALYRFNIDNSGDGSPNLIFEFRFDNQERGIELDIGGEQVPVALTNVGPVTSTDPASTDNLNVTESYRVIVRRRGGKTGATSKDQADPGSEQVIRSWHKTNQSKFIKPTDNVGTKSFPDYAAYAERFIYDIRVPGCKDPGRMFVGQRKESFAVNLGEVFDLVNLNPLGPQDAEPSATEDKNITTLALELPKACVTQGRTDIIGAWTTAHLPSTTVIDRRGREWHSQSYRQVSRLGMPLVNEVVIGLEDKDRFNASEPKQDLDLFATYVTNPTLPALLEVLFGVSAPSNFPRADLVAAFVTGIDATPLGLGNLNQFGIGEMVRLNTKIPATAHEDQNRLGVLGGDLAGFPNGRRPGDDVVDIELRVAMGALCHLPLELCEPEDAPAGDLPYTDGTLQDPTQFTNTFPYLLTPLPGSPNGENGIPAP